MVDFVSLFTGMSERDIGYLLKTMVQDSINSQLTNSEITEIDNKTPVLITNSKDVELINDISIQSAINIEPSTVYQMTEEPDGNNLKLWLKFQNAGELRDWSYQKNQSFSTGGNTMPGLFSKYNDDSMLKYELYSYFNGVSHYAHTLDSPQVRLLTNINESKPTSFFIRILPISLSRLLYTDNNSIFTKVDDDQTRYGYSVVLDARGNMHFYIKNNYTQYYLFVKDAYSYILTDPLYHPASNNFMFENYSKKAFLTGYEFLCGLVAQELPFDDWFFKYNPSTHNMSVINTTENNLASVFADTSLITEKPYLSCPIQEGKWTHMGTVQTTVYDNSGNNKNGTISGYATGGQWNDDNTLTSLGSNVAGTSDGMSIDFVSITSLNTLTEFTISFWINPGTELINSRSYNTRLVTKGYAVANSIYVERTAGQNDIKFSFRAGDNVEKTVTYPNAFPEPNKWYFVCMRWKSGEKLKIRIDDNTEVLSASNVTATLSTASNNIKLYGSTRAPVGTTISLFKFDNKQVQTSPTVDDWYYQGYHNPLFPKSENIQPVVEEDPDPILIPFSNVYTLDKMAVPTSADYVSINALSTSNPFIARYHVDDGTSAVDPEVQRYAAAAGVPTGGGEIPFTRIGSAPNTVDSSDNSSGVLGDGQNTVVALWLNSVSSGIGQTINGKVITKAIFYMRKEDATVAGTLYCKIWDATGVLKYTFPNTISANTITQTNGSGSSFTAYTFTGTTNTFAMAAGWRIGIEYSGFGSGQQVDLQRKSSPSDTSAVQTTYDGGWDEDGHTGFSIKCDLYTGGTGSPLTSPYYPISNAAGGQFQVAEYFPSGAPIVGQTLTKIQLRIYRDATTTGGATYQLRHVDTTGNFKSTLLDLPVSGLPTTEPTTFNIEWTNLFYDKPILAGEKISVTTTGLTTGKVYVLSNIGNNTPTTDATKNYDGTRSYLMLRNASSPQAWTTPSTSYDIAGNMYSGGSNFDAYVRFKDGVTRVCTKAVNSASSIHNKKISKVIGRFKKTGTPSGIVTATIRDANDVLRVQFSSVDVNTITADGSYHDVEFTNVVHNYYVNSALGSGDKICFEYADGTTSNYIELNVNRDVIDTSNTITQVYQSGSYTDRGQLDIAGTYYDGGEPDMTSRTKVAQSVEHQNSRLKGKKITRVKVFLVRSTSDTSGTVYCNIINSNNNLVKTIGTSPASGLTTNFAAPTEVTFEETTNNYPMSVGDKVSIEFNGGDGTKRVGVLIRYDTVPNYDGSNSFVRKYDEVDWDDSLTAFDLCAVMDEGGFLFTPEAGYIPDPTPTNIKDLLFCAGNNAKSGFLEAFLMEFRIYSKDITLNMADNLYNNRCSISPVGSGEILCPFSFRPVSLLPE